MSLPPLLKHIYNYGTEEVVRRGKKIFLHAGVQLLDVDHLAEQVRFRVRNDLYQNYYIVTVFKYLQPKNISLRCQCPYNLGEICRHEVAALFQLNDIVQSGFFENTDITYDQKHTTIRLRQVSVQMLRVFAAAGDMDKAEQWQASGKVIITLAKDDVVEAEVADEEKTYKVTLRQNDEKYFDTSCSCDASTHPLCAHKAAVFAHVIKTYGSQYFHTMRNWDEQKNKLLRQYGYSIHDDLNDKFEFIYDNGKPFLRVLDPSIKKVEHVATANIVSTQALVQEAKKRLCIVLDETSTAFPFVDILLVAGTADEAGEKLINGIEKLELSQYINPDRFKETDRELIPIIRKFTPDEMVKYLKKNLPFGDFLYDARQILSDNPNEEIKEQAWEYLLPKYQKLLHRFSDHPFCFLKKAGSKLSGRELQPVVFSQQPCHPELIVKKEGEQYSVALQWWIENLIVPFEEVTMLNAGLFIYQESVCVIGSLAELQIVERFLPEGKIHISAEEWPVFLEQEIMPWSQSLHVHFDDALTEKSGNAIPSYQLYLQEKDQTLVMKPAFSYRGNSIKWGFFGDVIQPHNGKIHIINRNEEAEEKFIHLLRHIHTDIQLHQRDHAFHLAAPAVLANNWFYRFADEMKEWNVELFGYDTLRNFRINTYKPDTRIHISSEIDWFDAQVEIVFGDQKVTIADVKKALAQKQNYVRLDDGTIGLLPEEWLKKYSLLLKMGEAKGSHLKVRKFHFSVLDELLSEVDEEGLHAELGAKKGRLEEIITSDFTEVAPPEKLKAVLRPYQLAGFQWLLFLHEAGWGGILADDMGLGKTVQALTFLLHYKIKKPKAVYLVVCPTTLVYNWENEIRKFTPNLKHFIHHGPKRTANQKTFEDYDIIITTYGTMRSDIRMFHNFEFDYVILDESQAIKNPQSQVAKASLLINAKNKLALSGTPVQNNTFDLYAQMNFLNPGMLGSREFFMNEFATPIDKFREADVQQQLRKLIYPFLLRRTKEQVAKDLPEKTETLLYCEMGKEQRKIYDAYRNAYKDQILGMIDEQGIERSQMHILQGLTKLRQICDSPAILNETEKFGNYSIKQDELIREIVENVGDHKALVFSQFLGMLALIRGKLEELNIPYTYFDGRSTSIERERAVQEFQNNDECRVFLISLKAGGIGLNLTAADYVYIVDPWWNPAVEQQAIDRTHRIGQTKNIFAYRLICKDSIEEKMLLLQDRKRALASELVADDSGFLKRLTREDIAYLLSE